MTQEKKKLLIKYLVCFGVAIAITLAVFWSKGFFTDSTAVNIQILSDGFTVSGLMLTMFAGLLYISGEGGFLGIGYVLRNVVLWFIPMGRTKQETYAKYRERKTGEMKKQGDHCILLTGLLFLITGIVFTVIWYTKFYQPPV